MNRSLNQPDLTNPDEALAHILEHLSPLPHPERVPLAQALGRVLYNDLPVPTDVPPCDNSAVDGYALRITDLQPGQPLPVSARIAAGQAPAPLAAGTAARIFTGAPVPPGADAVVMQENTEPHPAGVMILSPVSRQQNIRPQGQDLKAGDLALPKGTRLRPQELGLLASLGVAQAAVYRQLTVGILTTGNELVEPGQPLAPGQIYNTNRYTLLGLLQQLGCQVQVYDDVADTLPDTLAALTRAAAETDLIISSGGVSVGEEDHVRAAMTQLGELSLWRLALKPGKPLAFGQVDGTPMLGLPGNPAAVLVTFLVMGVPVIRTLQGARQVQAVPQRLPAAFHIDKPSIRREYLRARRELRDGQWQAVAYPNQSSGMLSSACWAEGLAVVPEHNTLAPGDAVDFLSFNELMGV
ncbi:MAG: molybdopterin molybdotransferase MoeA [Marinobacter sp.]|nr:molybdopterin molybdotransferase MoeA [Marinobacter sp.]